VEGCVSQEKWEKLKNMLKELEAMVTRADRVARGFRRAPEVAEWDSDLRRGTRVDSYRWSREGRTSYQSYWKCTGRRLNRQRLEEMRGFLNYVVRTYPWMNPYLKGLHLTIDGWRPGRVAGGWRNRQRPHHQPRRHMEARREWDHEVHGVRREGGQTEEEDTPAVVAVQPRLMSR